MRRGALAGLALTLGVAGGCLPAPEHRCAGDQDCTGGVCVAPPSACAFADPACKSGLRFGAGAGALASTCVAGDAEVDAGIDAAVDARPLDAAPGPDEDGDGIGDDVDNCPDVANPGQQDDGEMIDPGDGVGDACDPEPTRLGNVRVLFDGFHRQLDATWNTLGMVVTSGDALRLAMSDQVVSAGSYPRSVQMVIRGRGLGLGGVTPLAFSISAANNLFGNGVTAAQTAGANPRLRILLGANVVIDVASMPILGTTAFTLTLTTSRQQLTAALQIGTAAPITVRRISMQTLNDGTLAITNAGPPIAVDHVAVVALAVQ